MLISLLLLWLLFLFYVYFFHINTLINKYTVVNISTYLTIINNIKFFNIINFNRVKDALTLRREIRDGLEGRLGRRGKFLND